jgi:small subunit ribosomal protein S6
MKPSANVENSQYEIMFILSNQENLYQASLEHIKSIFSTHKIEIESEDDLGVKELAYEIQKHRDGHYHLFHVQAPRKALKELDHDLRLQEDILRFLVVRKTYKKDRYANKRKVS